MLSVDLSRCAFPPMEEGSMTALPPLAASGISALHEYVRQFVPLATPRYKQGYLVRLLDKADLTTYLIHLDEACIAAE